MNYGTDYDQVSLGYVLAEIDAKRGFSQATANPTEWRNNAQLINTCGNEIWTSAFWPELMNVEQRTYRVPWDAQTNWNAGDEVWREDATNNWRHYCRAVVNNSEVDPETDDGTHWLVDPEDFIPYIDFAQPWEQTIIEGVELKKFASRFDPRYVSEPAFLQDLKFIRKRVVFPKIDCWFDGDLWGPQGVTETGSTANNMRGNPIKPWVQFRPPWPKISGIVYDPTRNYSAGDLVFVPTDNVNGECYLNILACQGVAPNGSITNWMPVGVPEIFANYIIFWAAAERMSEEQGKYRMQAKADNEKARLEGVLMEQTGVGSRVVYDSDR